MSDLTFSSLTPGKPVRIEKNGEAICVARVGDQVFAIEHQGQALGLDRGHLQVTQAGEVHEQGGGEVQAAKFAVVHKRTLFRRKRGCASAKAAHHTRMWHRMWRIFERLVTRGHERFICCQTDRGRSPTMR